MPPGSTGGSGGGEHPGETVSAQTVSKLTRDLDQAVREFHQARLSDDYVYLFLAGVSLRRRTAVFSA
jgi:transposase-like protein